MQWHGQGLPTPACIVPHATRCWRLRRLGCRLASLDLEAPCRWIWQMDANSRVVEACICWSSVGLGCQSPRTHLQIPKALGWLVWYADATRCRQHRCRGRKLYADATRCRQHRCRGRKLYPHDLSVRFAELVGLAT